MLSESSKKRIKERKMLKHSNPSQFLKRTKEQSLQAIKDLTLIAQNLEEDQLKEIFTDKTLSPFIRAMLQPRGKRSLYINALLARLVANKLTHELPKDIVSTVGIDLQRNIMYATLLTDYYDKPIIRK